MATHSSDGKFTYLIPDRQGTGTLAIDSQTQQVVRIDRETRDGITRYRLPNGNGADLVDIETLPGAPRATLGAGSVHHIAFSVPDRASQLDVRKALSDTGYALTPVIDRDYFFSVYFRTPGGVLFEIATNEPGFDRDEDTAHLGEALKLPRQHEHLRARLEQSLEKLED